MTELEVFLIIDQNGDYATGTTHEGALDAYANDIGELSDVLYRVVRVPVRANLPKVVELAAVTVPDDAAV